MARMLDVAFPRSILLAAASCAIATLAHANDYPTKPVRFIVTTAAGGNVDLMARIVGQKLSEALGKPVVIDNRGGAGGVMAEEVTARAAPDGYTVLFASMAHVVTPQITRKLTYDGMKDLVPVSLLVSVPNVLVVNKALPVQSVPDLIALAKAKPGGLNYASSYGTTLHISGELFRVMAGVDVVAINYKSGGLAAPDLESGRVHFVFNVMTTAMSLVKTGRARALAVTSAKRSQAMPELPALAEFLPGYEVTGWQGMLVPARTPRPIVTRLADECMKIMRMPDVRAKLVSLGADPLGTTPEEFAAFRRTEYERIAKLVVKAGIKPE